MFYPTTIETMDIQSRETLERLLGEVVDWDGDYYLEEAFDTDYRPKTPIGCHVVFVGDASPAPTPYVYNRYSLLLDWSNREIVVPVVIAGKEGAQSFSEGVMRWYLANRRVSDHDVRVMIAKKLYERFLEQSENQAFDVDQIAQGLNLTPDRVFSQARVLVQLGYARSRQATRIWTTDMPPQPPLTPTQILGRFHLSEEGHRWAAANYPEEAAARGTIVTVNVDIHMAVTNVIQEARQSGVDENTKLRFEALMRRVEEELDKPDGEGNIQPVKEAIEVANNAKGLLGPLVRFMYQNWDKIENLGGMVF